MAEQFLCLAKPPMIRQMGISSHGLTAVQRWSNLTFWSLHTYHYRATLVAGAEVVQIEPGTITILPPGIDLEYRFIGPSTHVYAHLLPVEFGERRAIGLVHRPARAVFERFDKDFREAVGSFPHETPRACARVWDLLWRLIDPANSSDAGQSMPPLLSRALHRIALSMAAEQSVAQLADELDISQTHLSRLFRQYLSVSPLQYILRRRVERAEHLLRHTTLPIKAIAREIGLNDLQQFNKLMRLKSGRAPRRLRDA